jgi:hypothetical protein
MYKRFTCFDVVSSSSLSRVSLPLNNQCWPNGGVARPGKAKLTSSFTLQYDCSKNHFSQVPVRSRWPNDHNDYLLARSVLSTLTPQPYLYDCTRLCVPTYHKCECRFFFVQLAMCI